MRTRLSGTTKCETGDRVLVLVNDPLLEAALIVPSAKIKLQGYSADREDQGV